MIYSFIDTHCQAAHPSHFQSSPKSAAAPVRCALAAIENVWKKYNKLQPFAYSFLDDHYNALYQSERKTSLLFNGFTSLTIVIACVGLLGLASFSANQRLKEIGIRKVLGASTPQIILLLVKDFVVLILVSFLLSAPVAYWGMNDWLHNFSYRTELNWIVLLATSGIITLLATGIAISGPTLLSALINPVKSLKTE